MSILNTWTMPVTRDFETSQKFCAPTFHQINFDFLDGGECELVLCSMAINITMVPVSKSHSPPFILRNKVFESGTTFLGMARIHGPRDNHLGVLGTQDTIEIRSISCSN